MFVSENKCLYSGQVHLMIHPQLSRICMDRQIFRMLIINAILRSVANGRSSNESLISSSNLRSSRITTKNDAQSTSPLRVRPDIHEILIQVGYTPNESDGFLSADDEIESKIMYKYLSCSSGKIGSSVKSRDNKLKFLTIAFVDNGVRDEYNGRTAGTNALCENLVTSVLGGTYESFELPPTSSFRNVYRFSIPIGPVDNEVNGSYDSYYGSKLWLSPTLYTCHGFERPSKRYEYIRKIYSDRILSHANKSELQLGRGEHVPWKMLLVHPDLDIARQIASAFQMEGWDYAVETSCSTALANPELFRFDLLVICTSALSFDGQLISITDLNFRGFFGGLICLCDSGGPPDNSNKISYHIMEIPILRKSVLLASEIADRALLNYLIGTDKIVSV